MSGSKFKGLVDAARAREQEPPPEAEPEPVPIPAPAPGPPPAPPLEEKRKPGRPPGKRSNDSYTQITAYVPKQLHRDVKRVLFLEENEREISDLVETLLAEWLKGRKGK